MTPQTAVGQTSDGPRRRQAGAAAAHNDNGGRLAPTPAEKPYGRGALLGGHRQRSDRHVHASLGPTGELHVAIHQRKDRVIAAQADMLARLPLRAALAEDDVAGNHALTARLLDPEAPAFRVAPVARGAACLFVCHDPLLLRGDPWLG